MFPHKSGFQSRDTKTKTNLTSGVFLHRELPCPVKSTEIVPALIRVKTAPAGGEGGRRPSDIKGKRIPLLGAAAWPEHSLHPPTLSGTFSSPPAAKTEAIT